MVDDFVEVKNAQGVGTCVAVDVNPEDHMIGQHVNGFFRANKLCSAPVLQRIVQRRDPILGYVANILPLSNGSERFFRKAAIASDGIPDGGVGPEGGPGEPVSAVGRELSKMSAFQFTGYRFAAQVPH